jgi:hypothetical protein
MITCFLAFNVQYNHNNTMGAWVIHVDLATTLVTFRLVTFSNIKLHSPSFMIRSAIHWAMASLIFADMVSKLGSDMWLWGANQLVLWVFYNKMAIWWHFSSHVTTLETWRNQYWQDTWFCWQRTHVEFVNDVFPLHNIEW